MAFWTPPKDEAFRECYTDDPDFEAQNLRFLKEKTSIPVPTVVEEWKEENSGHYFLIVKRTSGMPLSTVWSTMTDDEKNRAAKQTTNYLQELRELQAPRIQSLSGDSLNASILFGGNVPHGPISSDDELWAEMEKPLSAVPEKVRQRLREKMPTAAPYTFTNGDLSCENILVEDGNVVGIAEWETSGYYPVWWETTINCVVGHCGTEDTEWKKLLLEHMPVSVDAREFYLDYFECLQHPKLHTERGRKLLENLD